MYNLSKDYLLMYFFLVAGNDIFCLVDYNFHGDTTPSSRDVCRCRKRADYNISFSVRGVEYGSVSDFEKEEGTEQQLFIKQCERMNLEWICPN